MAQFENPGTKWRKIDSADANPGDFYKRHRGNCPCHPDDPVSPNDSQTEVTGNRRHDEAPNGSGINQHWKPMSPQPRRNYR